MKNIQNSETNSEIKLRIQEYVKDDYELETVASDLATLSKTFTGGAYWTSVVLTAIPVTFPIGLIMLLMRISMGSIRKQFVNIQMQNGQLIEEGRGAYAYRYSRYTKAIEGMSKGWIGFLIVIIGILFGLLNYITNETMDRYGFQFAQFWSFVLPLSILVTLIYLYTSFFDGVIYSRIIVSVSFVICFGFSAPLLAFAEPIITILLVLSLLLMLFSPFYFWWKAQIYELRNVKPLQA